VNSRSKILSGTFRPVTANRRQSAGGSRTVMDNFGVRRRVRIIDVLRISSRSTTLMPFPLRIARWDPPPLRRTRSMWCRRHDRRLVGRRREGSRSSAARPPPGHSACRTRIRRLRKNPMIDVEKNSGGSIIWIQLRFERSNAPMAERCAFGGRGYSGVLRQRVSTAGQRRRRLRTFFGRNALPTKHTPTMGVPTRWARGANE